MDKKSDHRPTNSSIFLSLTNENFGRNLYLTFRKETPKGGRGCRNFDRGILFLCGGKWHPKQIHFKRKGGSDTENLTEKLLEELNCETVFTIPIFGGIGVSESVVVTWIIMAVLVGLSILFVRNLRIENPGKKQIALESAVGWANNFFEGIIGKENKRYIPYLITVILYLGVSNVISLFGFKPPTKDLNVTAALAIMSMFLIEYSGIHKNGLKHWAKHFAKPVPAVAPIMVLEIVIRPLSLCMRLFGNVLGAFIIMELLKTIIPVIVPIPFSFYFDIFDGLLQAYVFVFLTALFMNEEQE